MRRKKARGKHLGMALFSAVILSVLAAAYIYWAGPYGSGSDYDMLETGDPGSLETGGPIHWHPHLRIFLDDDEVVIPAGVGIIIGNVMDTEVSGMRMSPMHTHDTDGIIHMEQVNPTNRTLRLGYFFQVWGNGFNSTCLLGRCNSDGMVVKMTVNGYPSQEFDGYIPQDKDEIVIRFEREMFDS